MHIHKIEPPYWFAGMKHRELQLLVYGTALDEVEVSTTLPHLQLNLLQGTTPHSLIVRLVLSQSAQPGTYLICFTHHGKKERVSYELRPRRMFLAPEKGTLCSDDVVYLLMPDRFALSPGEKINPKATQNPNGWQGGTLNGIRHRMNYLQELGVTALWLTPILQNNTQAMQVNGHTYTSYHGYSITDFYAVDAHFGTLEDYQLLVEEAHAQGMKVIKDLVFNHCSHRHVWLKRPPVKGWFKETDVTQARKTNYCLTTLLDPYASEHDRLNTIDGWFTDFMPDLNLQNEEVWQYLTQVSVWWIETTGIDAIRMDTFLYADPQGMWRWLKYIDREYPGFSILAEAWVGDTAYTAQVQREAQAQTNTLVPLEVMDFAFRERMLECFGRKPIYAQDGRLYQHFVYDFLYPAPQQTLAFLDNHDTVRWFATCRGLAKQKQALALLLTCPRIPQLQYGTELGLTGDGNGTGDGNFRQHMFEKFLPEQRTDAENKLLAYVQQLLHWRKHCPAVCHGNMKHFIPQQGVYVYFRTAANSKVMVAANLSAHATAIKLLPYQEELNGMESGFDIISRKKYKLSQETLHISAHGILLLELHRKE